MKKRISNVLIAMFAVLTIAAPLLAYDNTLAVDPFDACKGEAAKSTICQNKNEGVSKSDSSLDNRAKNIINVGLMVVGVTSVVVIILSGIFYITSAGDAGRVKKAKDALMYAIVGLVVALLAFAIVNYVVDAIFPTT